MIYHRLVALIPFIVGAACAVSTEDEPKVVMDAGMPTYGSMSDPPHMNAGDDAFCLSSADAEILGRSFGLLISNYTTELAVQLLAEEFIDQADSVNTLINHSPLPHQPLGSLTFDSKEAFLEGQGAQPPVPFDILNTWNTCDTVIVRWRSHQKPDQVQGISIGVARPVREGESGGVGKTGKYQIKAIYAEFNSGAWLKNLGNPECKKENFKGWDVEV